VSARHTHAIYKIRRSDGAVLWRLGGKLNDFSFGPGARFSWQHDARRRPDGTLTLFDNAAKQPIRGRQSRAIVLRLDETRHTASLVRSYTHPAPLLSPSQGDAQFLANGNVVVGWGSNPYVTEFDAGGRVLLDLRFGSAGVDSYRAFRLPWMGHPADRPAVAARSGQNGRTVVSASWNGSTEVARWRVLAGAGPACLRRIAEAAKDGFETAIPAASDARYFAVQALDANGQVLRTSNAVRRPG
jgi:arylsulfotransferase ASST